VEIPDTESSLRLAISTALFSTMAVISRGRYIDVLTNFLQSSGNAERHCWNGFHLQEKLEFTLHFSSLLALRVASVSPNIMFCLVFCFCIRWHRRYFCFPHLQTNVDVGHVVVFLKGLLVHRVIAWSDQDRFFIRYHRAPWA
jgi:hypothetical protein